MVVIWTIASVMLATMALLFWDRPRVAQPPEPGRSLVAIAVDPAAGPVSSLVTPELYGYFIARTAYLDSVFSQALQDNLPQIVFLGAGYDTRAYRFREMLKDTRIFELDIKPTQRRKREMLQQAQVELPEQVTFVSIDFNTEQIEQVLAQAGHDKQKRTLFIWEGVTYYLAAEAITGTLKAVKSSSPAGSRLCFDYMTAPVPSTYTAEPFQFWIAPDKIEPFLAERGFQLTEHLGPAEIEKQYLTLADGSVAGKTLPFFCLAQAAVSKQSKATPWK